MNKVGEIRMEYRAVTKENPQKDLTHWKYLKREKLTNGKYRYYYEDENGKTSKLDRKADELVEQHKDALMLSLHDYEKMSDKDKQKVDKEFDEFDSEMTKIQDERKKIVNDMIKKDVYDKSHVDSGSLWVEQRMLRKKIII